MKKQHGSVLAIVLISISIMLLMIYVLAQLTTSQQKSSTNYMDMKIAENYARLALLQGESFAYTFDLNYSMESPPIICNSAATDLSHMLDKSMNGMENVANCQNLRRGWQLLLSKSGYDFERNGPLCNYGDSSLQGICYQRIDYNDPSFDSDYSWRPWESVPSSSIVPNIKPPCNTFSGNNITLLDASDANGHPLFAQEVNVYNELLCANPRFIIEPINLDYRGTYADSYYESVEGVQLRFESDLFTPANTSINARSGALKTYKMYVESNTIYASGNERYPSVPSTRLYRITAKAYGRNGDTRAILQEIIMVNGYVEDTYMPESGNEDNKPNLRISDDNPHNLAYRIVRISLRWIKP